jgi:hypothetical protein
MPTPSNVQTATTHNWLGSQAQFNILKPTIDPKHYETYGEEDITGLMTIMGTKNPVRSLQYRHFEDDRLHTIVTAAGTSTGADSNVVYTVDSAFLLTGFPSVFDPYLAASFTDQAPNASGTTTLHPVRLFETVMFPDKTQGTVIAITTTTFTVAPDAAGGILPTVTNADEIVLMGVTVGEGSDTAPGVNLRQDVFDNVLQIMSDSAKATGTSMGEQTWVNFEGKDGRMGYMWYYKQQDETLRRFKNFRELALVSGKRITNTANVPVVDATLLKTDGLYEFASSFNGDTNYSIAAGLSLSDFETLVIDNLDQNNGAMENCLMSSIRLRNSIDNFIRPEMQQGGVLYNAFDGSEEQSVNFGFSTFRVLGYTFHLKTYRLLNNPTLLGANPLFANSGLVLPMDKMAYAIGYEKKKETVGSFRMNYMVNDGRSREMEEWLTGGTDNVYTNQNDSVTMNLRTHFGFEGFGAPRFNVLQGI